MHSSVALLALGAIGAIAAPHRNGKRDYFYQTDVVTKVVYETVTFGGIPPSYTHPVHHPPHHQPPHQQPPVYTPPTYTPPAQTTQKPQPTQQPPPDQPSNPNLSDYANKALKHHNIHRANHSAPALEWDDGCAATAQKIADTCVFEHKMNEDGGGYGQNIAAGEADVAAVVTDMFYNGEVNLFEGLYGNPNPPFDGGWGHFTQVVWKDTTHFACALAACESGVVDSDGKPLGMNSFTVCNYKSAGNYAGEYADNVGDSLGHPSVTV